MSSPTIILHSPLEGVSVRQERYTIKHVLRNSEETRVMTAIARDTQAQGQRVVLKRWECTDLPLARRAKELVYYERATEPLARLRHPLIPRVLDRFAEGKHYYLVLAYVDGESLEERLVKFFKPLAEREVLGYMNTLLNILMTLEQQRPPLRHYDISPANIIIERSRGRVMLTGFQVAPPPLSDEQDNFKRHRTTRKLTISPYLPLRDMPYDQRTCIYMLAASMHHALTNYSPPHFPAYPPVRMLNPSVSPELELILSRALMEGSKDRYQSYQELQRDIKGLL